MNRKGAFLISREIFDNPIWTDVVKFRIFFFIVGNAVFSEEGVNIGGIHVGRGQFLRSYRNLADDLQFIENRKIKKYSVSSISRKVDALVKENRLEIEHTELGTLFTVVNYELYQGLSNYRNSNLEQRWNSAGTEQEQNGNNNNNVNNDNNVLSSSSYSPLENPDAAEITQFWDNNGFGFNNMNAKQMLLSWLENSPFPKPKEMIIEALSIACASDKRRLDYVEGILRNWINESKLTIQDVKQSERRKMQVINGGRTNETYQSSYEQDYSKYDFSKPGNVSWLQDGD